MADNNRLSINNFLDFFNLKGSNEKIKFLLKFAILAPSTHNSQPWVFKIKNNSCKIYINPDKKLNEADQTGRDLYISLGCCIENLISASKYYKVFKSIKLYPKNKTLLVAEISFKNLEINRKIDRALQVIVESIVTRKNSRGFFTKKSLPNKVISDINKINDFKDLKLHLVLNKEEIHKFANLTAEGLKIAYSNSSFRKEMYKWINNNFSQRKEGIPGFSLRMPNIMSLFFPYLVRFFDIGKMVSKINYQSVNSVPAIIVISSSNNNPLTWLHVGQLAEKVMLYLNIQKLKTSIFVASIEMGELHKEVQKIIKTNNTPQFLICTGYMNFDQKLTNRFSVEEKLVN